ncbi:hypothetical protein tinsulaeT_32200 [Thalassotalea insulae]|uniref:Solute-binding protein family 3/N-terminal domain-containing protein n=1 Tax=Thalassotalea insulae TaxID=2056778 RepID=A0ABQ6GYR3_9GAMM|nr:transporter substrate-binding domain-containing protein [Thalassotalea insulae]GLX79880.1 hypothetical protein tinsulaeT_32200 [Thalassotalea insulae]
MKHLLVIAGLLITSPSVLADPQNFLITRHKDSSALKPCVDKITKAYQLLSINFTLKEYPGRRSLYMANSGKADAELCRISLIERRYKNLLRVEPAIHHLAFHAITQKGNKHLEKIADLKGLRVGSIRGMMAAELVFEYQNVRYENKVEQSVRLLENDLVDVLVLAMPDINQLVIDGRLSNKFIHPTPLYQFDLYHYIHARHKDKLALFNQTFQKLTDKNDYLTDD